jgi:Arc/MetJ-type ribon-helix-helix transcriptional regulator
MMLEVSQDLLDIIDKQVECGRFPTRESVLEAAVRQLEDDPAEMNDEIDAETEAAILEGHEQAMRGEVQDFKEFMAEFMKSRMPR